MSNKENKQDKAFESAFGDLLKKEEPASEIAQPEGTLNEALFGSEEKAPMTQEEWEKVVGEYVPPSVHDEQWEEFASRTPIPPLNREQEARAVSLGLQEIRKTKEYMLYIYRHMCNEFKTIYATYPLLFEKDFQEKYGDAHKAIISVMEDMEHLIAGDIDRVEEVKGDFKLQQAFEEKRLSILYQIIEYYNKK